MEKIKNKILHFFIPTESNNFRAKALHNDFLTYYLIFALVLIFSFKKINLVNVLGFATDISIEKLNDLTNKERVKQKLNPLTYNNKLAEAAYKKGKDMFAKNYWAHYAPDGTAPWDFILSSDYQYEYAGENLAKNFLFSQIVVDTWMNSQTHKENILRKEYSEVGYAVVNGVLNGEETTLVVQMFGKPIAGAFNQSLSFKTNLPVINSHEIILANQNPKPKINLFNLSFDLTYFFLIFLSFILFTDFYVASRLNIIRINGKNVAHLIFLSFIIIGISFIIAKSGAII